MRHRAGRTDSLPPFFLPPVRRFRDRDKTRDAPDQTPASTEPAVSVGGLALLPGPSSGYLDLEREAQECTDDDDAGQGRHACEVGRGGDSPDDVAGAEQLEAEQDGLAELPAEALVDGGLAPGPPSGGGRDRDRSAGDDDHDPGGVDGHPGLFDHVVINHLAPLPAYFQDGPRGDRMTVNRGSRRVTKRAAFRCLTGGGGGGRRLARLLFG